ncbi:MAG: stalk domain-containing protein [Syntrophomonadaceae bacterium]|nr:stalk domain-containing protein [Syntrophomonadaceae bacterium]MDD3270842.1 stalk domain-containing protein [Syntrophomonadaceae bacterium]MDD3898031.1 stalk domain-containing protein [Syntrophomonadaceae bacterium]MDD4562243.1 stalk domain-containing protein [Syntrophomonadaceae bacterium]
MKKKWILMLAVVMLFAFTAGVVAAPAVQEITANLANDVKITLNGNAWTPKDADGSTMVPILYQGRTYLPVRAVGEALGLKVDWDKDTRTVILGEAAVKPEPKKEEPKVEPKKEEPKVEPVKEEPKKEEPKPAAELAISPAGSDYNKNKEVDVPINITWGSATKITAINGSAMGGALKLNLVEGTHYAVTDNGDGTGVLTIKTALTSLLPIPITAVPDGTELTLTIKFDQGEKTFVIKVVS